VTPAWRIVKKSQQAEAFSGKGARLYGGRWNQRGTAVVYTADSLALAALEYFVHLGPAMAAVELISFRAEIPPRVVIRKLNVDALPANWRSEPPPQVTRAVGTDWAGEGATAVLRVPSALIHTQHNFILNPHHRDFRKIRISEPRPFRFDSRMWKQG
jgi:RES domain-containing protein